jgi:hypothetical protein
MADQDNWDRDRAAIIPVTIVLAFFTLNSFLIPFDDTGIKFLKLGLFCMIPGSLIGLIIRLKTKTSQGPEFLITLYAILSFVMSIVWINFTSNCIMDLL